MSNRRNFSPWLLIPLWAAGSSIAGLVIGLAVGLFKQGGIEAPILGISVLFGNVVGFTALISAAFIYPRLRSLPPALRIAVLTTMLLSGSAAGSVAVMSAFPLFVMGEPRQAIAVVAINAILGVIVGGITTAYESMHERLQESLREVEEGRLVESQLREQAARAELAALQARINPHFFFNTLNTVSSLLEDDPEEAQEVIASLAGLFRYTFKAAGAASVPLEEELAFIRSYLRIEQARFGDRLQVDWNIAAEGKRTPLPGLILQPLVENAIGHGIAPLARGGRIAIDSRVDNGHLQLTVTDDGRGLNVPASQLFRDGHGLGNVRQRLETYYRGAATFALDRGQDGLGTVARIVVPRETGEAR